MSSQLFIATCGSQYAFHLVHHPLPGFELGTPTTDRLWPHFDHYKFIFVKYTIDLKTKHSKKAKRPKSEVFKYVSIGIMKDNFR